MTTLWQDFVGAEVRYIDTPSCGRTRIIEAGTDNKDVLIFMHGMGGHAEAYCKNVVPLSDQFHVIAFDFIAHGLSAKLDIDYSLDIYTQHILEVMDVLGIEKATLIGESMGGGAAGVLAAENPSRVDKLILVTSGGIPIVTEQGREDLKNLAAMSAKSKGQKPTFESVQARMRWLLHEKNWGMLTDELIELRLQYYSQPELAAIAPKVFGFLKGWVAGTYEPPLIPLEKLETETLFLWTEHNPMHDLPAAESAVKHVKNGKSGNLQNF